MGSCESHHAGIRAPPPRDGVLSSIAARLRIPERLELPSDEIVSFVVESACRAHELLHASMKETHRSLCAALRRAADLRIVTDRVVKNLRRVSPVANILRHVTRFSVDKCVDELLRDLGSAAGERGSPAVLGSAESLNVDSTRMGHTTEFYDIS